MAADASIPGVLGETRIILGTFRGFRGFRGHLTF